MLVTGFPSSTLRTYPYKPEAGKWPTWRDRTIIPSFTSDHLFATVITFHSTSPFVGSPGRMLGCRKQRVRPIPHLLQCGHGPPLRACRVMGICLCVIKLVSGQRCHVTMMRTVLIIFSHHAPPVFFFPSKLPERTCRGGPGRVEERIRQLSTPSSFYQPRTGRGEFL
jgi:hypothetical protein